MKTKLLTVLAFLALSLGLVAAQPAGAAAPKCTYDLYYATDLIVNRVPATFGSVYATAKSSNETTCRVTIADRARAVGGGIITAGSSFQGRIYMTAKCYVDMWEGKAWTGRYSASINFSNNGASCWEWFGTATVTVTNRGQTKRCLLAAGWDFAFDVTQNMGTCTL
jgi:hypothetical protein